MSRAVPPSVLLLTGIVAAGLILPGGAAHWALYPALGLFPGLALAEALPLGPGMLPRWALGLAVSPLATTVSAWLLMTAGLPLPLAAGTVALCAWGAWVALALRRSLRAGDAEAPLPGARFAWRFALGAGLLVALVMMLNPFIRVRSDGWTHAGIAWEIFDRGIPPEDPRFAGLPLNYVWFFNYFIALLTALRHGDPFIFMAISSTADMISTVLIAWFLGWRLWGTARAGAGAVLMMSIGFNAGTWMIAPLEITRALVGHQRGWAEARRIVGDIHLRDTFVIFSLHAPFAMMLSFLDKFLLGTALHTTYLLMLLYFWALLEWLRKSGRGALVWGAAAAAGMLLFHGVVGLSVIPVAIATLTLAAGLAPRWTWLPAPRRLATFAAASALGALLATPYTLSVARGWPAEKSGLHHSYFNVNPYMLWTLVTTISVGVWVARRPLGRVVTERHPEGTLLALFSLAMVLFASVVSLPLNNQTKFIFELYAPIAAIGGVGLFEEFETWARRAGRWMAWALFALVFGVTPALTLFGYLADPGRKTAVELNPAPGEERLYAWIQQDTPVKAVFVDYDLRSLIMVKGRRELFLGTRHGNELAAFPLAQMSARRTVMEDLYGRCDQPQHDARALAEIGRPAYVLVRGTDFTGRPSPTRGLDGRPDLFARVYDRDGFVVYRVSSLSTSTADPDRGDSRP